jgi:hypothetical protein
MSTSTINAADVGRINIYKIKTQGKIGKHVAFIEIDANNGEITEFT